MKKTSKFKSKKYPRLKKYADGDVVESAAITEQKRQQEELNAQARQDKNAATAAKGAGAALGAYSAYQSGQAGQGTKAQKDAASYEGVIDSFAGTALPWYALAKQGSDLATSAVPQKTITNKETGEVVTDYSGTSGKQAAAVFKPQHEMAVEDLSSGNTGLAVAEMFLPGLGYESRSNALGMQKGINKLFGSEENDAAANFAKAEAANKAYDEQQKQAYDSQQAQQQAYMNQQIQSGINNYYSNPDNNKNKSQTFAMGGVPQMPNAEVENDEFITSQTAPVAYEGGGFKMASNNPAPGGVPTYESVGRTHSNGGIIAKLEDGGEAAPAHINGKTKDFLFKKNILAGKKFADTMRNITNQERYNTKKLENGNKEAKASANLMLPILARAKEDANARQKIAIDADQAIKDAKKYRDDIYKNGAVPSMNNDQPQNEMVMAKYGAQIEDPYKKAAIVNEANKARDMKDINAQRNMGSFFYPNSKNYFNEKYSKDSSNVEDKYKKFNNLPKNRMGGMQMLPKYDDGGPLLSPEGYNSINQFENTVGTYDKNTGLPAPMNAGDQYAQTGGSSNAVKEIEDYIDSSIGRDAWDKLPDNIKTQMYDAMFNSGGANKDYYMRGLAQSIYNSDPNSKNYGMTGKDQRNALDLNESFNTIKNADYSSDDIYNNFVGIRGEQLNSIGKNSKFPDAYMPTYSSRAISIDANYKKNSAANKPVTPGVPVNPNAVNTNASQGMPFKDVGSGNVGPVVGQQDVPEYNSFYTQEDEDKLKNLPGLNPSNQYTPANTSGGVLNNPYSSSSQYAKDKLSGQQSALDRIVAPGSYDTNYGYNSLKNNNKNQAKKAPPKDYSNYADYAREAAIFAGQNLGNISDLIRTRGGRKYDKESYGQMTPQMPDFTEAKRNAKSEASAYRRMLPGLTGGNAGATLGMMGQMQGLSQQALAKIVEGEQQARTGVYNQFLPLNKQLQMQERADTQANKARSEDIARMATSGIAATIGGAGLDYGMSKSDQEKLDLISKAYPDYNYDKRKKAWYHKYTNEKLDPTKVQAATTTGK